MIDLVPLIDAIGEPATLALGAFAFAFLFGIAAERSGFCTRSAVLEIMDGKAGKALVTWLAAFGSTILLVQLALLQGWAAAEESRFFATAQSLSGPVIGGVLFGIGMALARGCSSRLLVLGAAGNIRALVTVAVMGVVGWFTISGFLVPIREAFGGLVSTNAIGDNALSTLVGGGDYLGVFIGVVIVALAAGFAIRAKISSLQLFAGGLIGLAVAGLWAYTSALFDQVFEPIAVESLSFIRPSASIVSQTTGQADSLFTFDTGIIVGILASAFLASIVFGSFKIRNFSDADAPHFLRYIAGGALMGFGGVTAVGCTIGAGFTGGSVLAVSSLLGLASIMLASGATDWVLSRRLAEADTVSVVPAE